MLVMLSVINPIRTVEESIKKATFTPSFRLSWVAWKQRRLKQRD
jgi:hypothetical protein